MKHREEAIENIRDLYSNERYNLTPDDKNKFNYWVSILAVRFDTKEEDIEELMKDIWNNEYKEMK